MKTFRLSLEYDGTALTVTDADTGETKACPCADEHELMSHVREAVRNRITYHGTDQGDRCSSCGRNVAGAGKKEYRVCNRCGRVFCADCVDQRANLRHICLGPED